MIISISLLGYISGWTTARKMKMGDEEMAAAVRLCEDRYGGHLSVY
jgi:hypothetical protein